MFQKFSQISTFTLLLLGFSACTEQSDPVIVLNGDSKMVIYVGEQYEDPGATATDYKGRDITSEINVSGTVGPNSGSYTLDYTVSDQKGNFAVAQRVVSRGFKNSDLDGTYTVVQNSTNGGGTQTFSATVTAGGGDIVTVTMDNTNSITAPVLMVASITTGGTQLSIPDQTYSGTSITNGQYNYLDNSSGSVVINVSFQTNNGIMTYNHDATWTKQ